MDQVSVKLLFFAKARELVQVSASELSLSSQVVKQKHLYSILEAQFPQLLVLQRSYALALNEEYLDRDLPDQDITFSQSDELAIIPPISGG